MIALQPDDGCYKPEEVAELFAVVPVTVRRWRLEGKLDSFLTPGGQHRYLARRVNDLLGIPARHDCGECGAVGSAPTHRPGCAAAQIPGQLTLPA